ncbi:hypothetical protein [Spirosoma telluris]
MDCILLRWPIHLGKLLTMLCLLSVPALAQTISGKVTNTGDGAMLPA